MLMRSRASNIATASLSKPVVSLIGKVQPKVGSLRVACLVESAVLADTYALRTAHTTNAVKAERDAEAFTRCIPSLDCRA